MSNNVNDILKQLDALNESSGIDIYIPSLKKNVKFKNLNLKQQKEILKSSIDETLTKLSFVVKFFSIIKENVIDDINVDNLYIFDRLLIAIAFRANGLDANYATDGKTINLFDVLKQAQTIDSNLIPLNAIIDEQNFSVHLEVPHLIVDSTVNSAAIAKLKTTQEKDVKTLVGELFVHEIVKFIKKIVFKAESGDTTVVFADLKVSDKITIIEKISSTTTNKILEFIKAYREQEGRYTTYDGTSVEVDGSFFSV
jgi:hypothetical protein